MLVMHLLKLLTASLSDWTFTEMVAEAGAVVAVVDGSVKFMTLGSRGSNTSVTLSARVGITSSRLLGTRWYCVPEPPEVLTRRLSANSTSGKLHGLLDIIMRILLMWSAYEFTDGSKYPIVQESSRSMGVGDTKF